MSNYLNNLNQIIKINTASISNTESKDAFLLTTKRSRDDLNKVANYINNLLVPALKSLASGPRYIYDAAQIGISGLTLVTYPEAQGNNSSSSPLYWKPGTTLETGRPCTVKESFDFLLGSLVDRIVGVENVAVDLSVITDDIACGGFNLQRVKDDVLGQSYNLDCTSTPNLNWPLAKHLYEIISQLTTGVDQSLIQNMNDGSAYPALTLNLNSTLTLDDLSDVISIGASVGEGLVYNGTNWVPGIIASQEATEEISGTLEVASVSDIAQVLGVGDSTSGTSYLAITTEALYGALDVDALDGGATNLLRDRVKEVALEQINESSVFELSDVDESGTLFGKQSLMFNAVTNKFSNRYIVWDDIMQKPDLVQNLNDLGDVVINEPETNHIIYYDGDKWTNRVSAEESIDNSAVEYLVSSFLVHDKHTGINFVHDVLDHQIIGTVAVSDLNVNDEDISLLENEKLILTNTDDNIIISDSRDLNNNLLVNFNLNTEITASTITTDVITANTFIGTIENAVYAQTANYANYLNNPDNIILAGAVNGTGDFPVGGTGNPTNNIVILTSLTQGSVTNDKLANDKITLTAAGTTRDVPLGGNITLLGTTNEIDLAYGSSGNVVSFSLPENINANASSADKLKTPRNITLTGGVTGSGSFDGSGNLNITTTVASTTTNLSAPTNTVRGGVLLAGTGSDNASGYIQRRNIEHFSAYIEKNFYTDSSNTPTFPGGINQHIYSLNHHSSQCFVIFRNMSSQVLTLSEISFNFVYGGLGTAGSTLGQYQFGLAKMSTSSSGFITIQSLVTLPEVQAPSTTQRSGWGFLQNIPSTQILPKQYFGVTCIKHPDKHRGLGLTVQISGSTPIGNYLY